MHIIILGSSTNMPNIKDSSNSIISTVKLVVLGSGGVGKSAIVMQYVRGIFIESYDPTLEDSFSKRVKLGSHIEPVNVEILDTAGSDQFSAMRDMYIGSGDVFLLVYSVDSKVSFIEACNLFNRIKAVKAKKSFVMLVGNKTDLSGKYRRVTYEQASFFAHQNRISFMEVSARKNLGITDCVNNILKIYISSGQLKRQPLGLMSKLDDKNTINDKKERKSSIISSFTKKESRDCIIM